MVETGAYRYPRVWEAWLQRFTDKAPEVRTAMVRVALKVAASRGAARAALLPRCAERLSDPDWAVRRHATRAAADALLEAAPRGLDDDAGGAGPRAKPIHTSRCARRGAGAFWPIPTRPDEPSRRGRSSDPRRTVGGTRR